MRKLHKSLKLEREKNKVLERRRRFDHEGYLSDIAQMRQQISGIERSIYKKEAAQFPHTSSLKAKLIEIGKHIRDMENLKYENLQ